MTFKQTKFKMSLHSHLKSHELLANKKGFLIYRQRTYGTRASLINSIKKRSNMILVFTVCVCYINY